MLYLCALPDLRSGWEHSTWRSPPDSRAFAGADGIGGTWGAGEGGGGTARKATQARVAKRFSEQIGGGYNIGHTFNSHAKVWPEWRLADPQEHQERRNSSTRIRPWPRVPRTRSGPSRRLHPWVSRRDQRVDPQHDFVRKTARLRDHPSFDRASAPRHRASRLRPINGGPLVHGASRSTQ